MDLRGWVRTSLIDFPGHIATVCFTGGCNFRCPMCHNADLVLRPEVLPRMDTDDLWTFLRERVGRVTGLVITGGEPTLQPDLPDFVATVRDLGYRVKLDTNGYRPDVLADLLAKGQLDYVAMDIKAPPDKYADLAGVPGLELRRIEDSLEMLRKSKVAYELRTTVVPGLLAVDDVVAIARWLADQGVGATTTYVLQQFRSQHTLDPDLTRTVPYTGEDLREAAARARAWLPQVSCRGV